MARPGWRLEAICVLLLRSDQRSRGCRSMTITQFGRFRVDLHRRELLADGQSLSLGSRALDLLIVLLEARGKLVTKAELMSRVWPDTHIDWSRSEAKRGAPQPSRCPSWVMSVALCDRWLPIDFRYSRFATEVMRRCKMTRRANARLSSACGYRGSDRTVRLKSRRWARAVTAGNRRHSRAGILSAVLRRCRLADTQPGHPDRDLGKTQLSNDHAPAE
jgi:hypothetical protein